MDTALIVVNRLLEKMDKHGENPELIAFTLWGTDNIKPGASAWPRFWPSLASAPCLTPWAA